MPSIQETLRAALVADATLMALLPDANSIYPGQLPDDNAATPLLYYAVPTSEPYDALDDADGIDVLSEVEFHALADRYDTAMYLLNATVAVLKGLLGSGITSCQWAGSSEDTTDDGYHHACRFKVMWKWVL